MKLKRLILNNFCQYRRLDVTFNDGMTLITGPNGAGKTNLLSAILFALSGEIRTGGRLTENITTGSDGPSDVRLWLQQDGQNICVVRSLRPRTDKLWHGDISPGEVPADRTPLVSGTTGVTRHLCRVLHTSVNQLTEHVFIGQRQLDQWFTKTQAARVDELRRLFGLDRLQQIYEALGRFSLQYAPRPPQNPRDFLQEQRQSAQQRLDQVRQKIAELDVNDSAALRARILQLHTHQRTHVEYAAHQAKIQQLQVAVRDAQTRVTQEEAAMAKCRQALDAERQKQQSDRDNYTAATAALRSWQEYDELAQRHTEYCRRQQEFHREWPQPPEPPEPPDISQEELQAQKLQLTKEEATLSQILEQLDASVAASVCVVCEAALPDNAAHLQRRRAEVAEKLRQVVAAQGALSAKEDALRRYQQALQQHQRQLAEYAQRKTALAQTFPPPLPAPPAMPADAARKIVQQAESQAATIGALATELQVREQSVVHARDELRRQRERYEEERGREFSLPEQSLEELQQELSRLLSQSEQLADLEQRAAELRQLCRQLEQQHRQHQTAWDTYQREVAAMQVIQRTRELVSSNRGQRDILRVLLSRLTGEINGVLQTFEAPFRADIGEDLGFELIFPGVKGRQPDHRLSVGERLLLSWAFRVALNSLQSHTLGLLSLDEPTAGLDEDNVRRLPEAISRLHRLVESRGLQVLFVSHELWLARLFDGVIQLGSQ